MKQPPIESEGLIKHHLWKAVVLDKSISLQPFPKSCGSGGLLQWEGYGEERMGKDRRMS